MILVSACLLGLKTRYDGRPVRADLPFNIENTGVIPICPEQLGGLPTPRTPACIINGTGADVLTATAKVVTKDGQDVTENYRRGAEESVKLAQLLHVDTAYLTEKSPACGVNFIKDLDGTTRRGMGVCAAALTAAGISCIGIAAIKTDLPEV